MSNYALLIGGYGTGRSALYPVAEAMVGAELANDVAVVPFTTAMENPERLARIGEGRLVLTHSAGALAVSESAMSAGQWVAYNGPVPTTIPGLIAATSVKYGQYLSEIKRAYREGDQNLIQGISRVALSNVVETATYPYRNLSPVPEIRRFSTPEALRSAQVSGIAVSAVVTDGDAFFPYNPGIWGGINVDFLPGVHDQLLISPRRMLVAQLSDKPNALN
jgi:hypothetical protein